MTAEMPSADRAQTLPAGLQSLIAQAGDVPEYFKELTELVLERHRIERRILELCPDADELLTMIHAPGWPE